MTFELNDPNDAYRFAVGMRLVPIRVPGHDEDDEALLDADHPLAQLRLLLGWLVWVANGCRVLVVTDVDLERGTFTLAGEPCEF